MRVRARGRLRKNLQPKTASQGGIDGIRKGREEPSRYPGRRTASYKQEDSREEVSVTERGRRLGLARAPIAASRLETTIGIPVTSVIGKR